MIKDLLLDRVMNWLTVDRIIKILDRMTSRLQLLIERRTQQQNALTNRLNVCISEKQRAIRIQSNLESLLK
jgi:hypothetical protein